MSMNHAAAWETPMSFCAVSRTRRTSSLSGTGGWRPPALADGFDGAIGVPVRTPKKERHDEHQLGTGIAFGTFLVPRRPQRPPTIDPTPWSDAAHESPEVDRETLRTGDVPWEET